MYLLREDTFVKSFQKAHPFPDDPRFSSPPRAAEEYFDLCIQTNEIVGIEFLNVDGVGFIGMPNFIDGFERKATLMKEAISCWSFPEHVGMTRDIKIPFRMRTYWFKKDFDRLYSLTECTDPYYIMRESVVIAQEILERSPSTLGVVCGPISSGPNSVEKNLQTFARTVFKIGQEIPLFNQLPFEQGFHVVHQAIKDDPLLCPNGSSSRFFIDHFYEKLFRLPGRTWLPQFIFGYKKSEGAMIEHQIFSELGSKINELPPSFTKRLF